MYGNSNPSDKRLIDSLDALLWVLKNPTLIPDTLIERDLAAKKYSMKQDFPVTPVRNSLDRNHSIWTFQPNQVYRLINLIREHEFHVMVSVAGTMTDDCGNFVNVDYDDFTVDLQTLSKYKAPLVTVKIQRAYKRILVLRIDQKGYKKVTYEEIRILAKSILAEDSSKKAEIKAYLTDKEFRNIGQTDEVFLPDFHRFLLNMQANLK